MGLLRNNERKQENQPQQYQQRQDMMQYASSSTPPGFNKNKRDQCRFLLGLVCVLLFTGHHFAAAITSAAAFVRVKEGTIESTKNLKWLALSGMSFCASLTATILIQGYDVVDEDKSYSLKICLWLGAHWIQTGWSSVLAFFLYSAWSTKG